MYFRICCVFKTFLVTPVLLIKKIFKASVSTRKIIVLQNVNYSIELQSEEPYFARRPYFTTYFESPVISSFYTETDFFLLLQMNSNTFFTNSFKEMIKFCSRILKNHNSKMWRNMVPLAKYGSLLYKENKLSKLEFCSGWWIYVKTYIYIYHWKIQETK